MRTRGFTVFAVMLSGLTACSTHSAVPRPVPGAGSRVVKIGDEPQYRSRTVLEVLRTQLPVVVQQGRFTTDEGITSVCVHGRRSSALRAVAHDGASGLPVCRMALTYVDRVRVWDAGLFLASARADEYESVELLSSTEAQQRYGLFGGGGDVLVLWTRGRSRHPY